MLKINVEVKEASTDVELEGQIDETVALDQQITTLKGILNLNGAKVTRINSTGVKKWILYLESVAKKTKIQFHQVSPALVEQFNLISNFGAGGKVLSLGLPYQCGKCNQSFTIIKTVEQLTANQCEVKNEKCPKCGDANAEFDDIPEDYFQFLKI